MLSGNSTANLLSSFLSDTANLSKVKNYVHRYISRVRKLQKFFRTWLSWKAGVMQTWLAQVDKVLAEPDKVIGAGRECICIEITKFCIF